MHKAMHHWPGCAGQRSLALRSSATPHKPLEPRLKYSVHAPHSAFVVVAPPGFGVGHQLGIHIAGPLLVPTFVLDTSNGIKRSTSGLTLGTKSPISSDCTANPFNQDGDACQGGASGKAFFLFNDGAKGARKIFGDRFK